MISKRDLQLGKIALKAGMVTKDQITRCLALKKKLAAEKGKKVSLGALLIKKGYLTEAQLEELVKLQPVGGTSEVSGEASGVEGAPKKSKKKKKKKKAAGATSEASGETATATSAPPSEAAPEAKSGDAPAHGANGNGGGSEEAVAEAARESKQDDEKKADEDKKKKSGKTSRGEDTGRSKRAKAQQSARQKAEKPSAEGSTAGAVESAVESTGSEVDPSIFLSAPEGAADEDDKRLIACPECGKKYRVRAVQQGKRFSCRRCKNQVKVPKDLFDKPLEKKGGKKKSKGEVEVEEFTLGSSDQTEGPADGGSGDEKADAAETKTSARTAAVKAAVAIQKVQAQASIADLARAAAKAPKKGLPVRRKFGVAQALTLVACVGAVVGIVGGVIAFKQHLAAVEEEQRRAVAVAELDSWKKKVQEVLDRFDPAIKARQPSELGALISDLQSRVKEHEQLAKGDNRKLASDWLGTLDLPARRRSVLLARADALWQSGTVGADESLQVLGQALDLAKDDDELAVVLGRRLIKAGKTAEAAQRTNGRASPAAAAVAGLAFERGGAAEKAAANYNKLTGPLAAVLSARAYLSDRNADRALAEVAKASDATGNDLAAAKMVEAQAQAMRDDLDAARRAVGEAISATKELPWPKALEGELLLRAGDAAGALAAFQAANQIAGTARGYLGIGDAHAVLLDLDRARSAWNDASAAPLLPQGSPLAPGEVDPFEAPLAPDPRALARCRIGALDAAAGRPSAAEEYGKALQVDPFCVEAEAGLAILDVRTGNLPFADGRLQSALARVKKQGGNAGESVRSATAATTLVARAFYLIASGRPKDAAELLKQATAADPSVAPQAAALGGRLLEAQNLNTEAFAAFAEAARLEVQATFPASRPFQAASKLLAAGAPDGPTQEKVLAGVTATLAQNPWHARAYLLRAKVFIAQGKASQALPALDQAIALNTYLRDAYVARGFLYVRDLPERERTRETAGKASEDFKTALRIELGQGGEKAETYRGLALVAFSQNALTDAHEAATKAIGLDPQDAEALRVRAQIRTRQGNGAGAKEDLDKAAKLEKK